MKRQCAIENEHGLALILALVVMFSLVVIGAGSMMMSNLGFTAVTAEKKYQLANWAAEYALSKAADDVVQFALTDCPTGSGTVGSGANTSSYSYFSKKPVAPFDEYCMLHATGTHGGARVFKTAVLPRPGTEWGGMITRGGTINLSGSSAIAGCDDDENTYADRCGVLPAVIYSSAAGLSYTVSQLSNPGIHCANEGTLRGFEGNPPINPTTFPNDLVPLYFGVTDTNGNGSAWDELMTALELKYPKTIAGQTIIPDYYPNLPTTPTVTNTATTECDYTGPNACETTNATTIQCGGGGTEKCNKGIKSDCIINISQCSTVFTDKSLTIKHNINDFSRQIFTTAEVTVSSSVSNLNLTTSGSMTITGSNTTVNSSRISAGSVTVGATVSNSQIQAGGNVSITQPITNTNVLSGGTVTFSTSMTDSNIMANALNGNFGSQVNIQGGVYYARTNVTVNANGSPSWGSITNPALLLVGDPITNPTGAGTTISMPGNFTFNGLMYLSAITVDITGAVEFQGMVINSSTSATINNTGNGTIQFQKRVLDNLKARLGDTMRTARCGAGNKNDYLQNTKVTLY